MIGWRHPIRGRADRRNARVGQRHVAMFCSGSTGFGHGRLVMFNVTYSLGNATITKTESKIASAASKIFCYRTRMGCTK